MVAPGSTVLTCAIPLLLFFRATFYRRSLTRRQMSMHPVPASLVLPDSVVQFEGSSVRIAHGGTPVSTARGAATAAGDVKVTPASKSWTQFDVIDVDGTVRIAVRKGDVAVSDSKGTVTLAQGQETTRDDLPTHRTKKRKRKRGAAMAQLRVRAEPFWIRGLLLE